MNIQFICTGNTFRSRLAEAYLKSKNIPELVISSSGIDADRNYNGPVCEYTVKILDKFKLTQYLSETWRMTSKEDIESQDLIVFMEKLHYDFCVNTLRCKLPNYEIWGVPDVKGGVLDNMPFVEKTFENIKEKVNKLLAEMPPLSN